METLVQTLSYGSDLHVRATVALREYIISQNEMFDELCNMLHQVKHDGAQLPPLFGSGVDAEEMLNGLIQLRSEAIEATEMVLEMFDNSNVITFDNERYE